MISEKNRSSIRYGFWKSFDNLKTELLPICSKLGRMPSRDDLQKLGRIDINDAIKSHHGGYRKISKMLGYDNLKKRPNGFFRDFSELQKELIPICEKFGRMPTEEELDQELRKLGLKSLERAIREHGGRAEVAKKLGYSLKRDCLPNGYWKDFKYLSELLLPICKKLGRMPATSELNEMGYYLDRAFNNFGGKAKVTARLGYEALETPKNFFKDFSNLQAELLPICQSLGYLPGRNELREMGRGDLVHAITTHHKGFRNVEGKIGYRTCADWVAIDGHRVQSYLEQKVDNLLYGFGIPHVPHPSIKTGSRFKGDFSIGDKWMIECLGFDIDNTKSINCVRYLRHWQKKGKLYPKTDWKLVKISFDDTAIQIKKKIKSIILKYASFKKQIISDEEIEKPPFYYADFGNVESRLRELSRDTNSKVTVDWLREKGEHNLVNSIYNFHGGWQEAAGRLSLTTAQRPKNQLKDFAYVKSCLKQLELRLGHPPNSIEVRSADTSLHFAIFKYHGGWEDVAKRLDFPLSQRPKNQLKDLDYVKSSLKQLELQLGHFPSYKDLRLKDTGLLTAIYDYHGGWLCVRKLLQS